MRYMRINFFLFVAGYLLACSPTQDAGKQMPASSVYVPVTSDTVASTVVEVAEPEKAMPDTLTIAMTGDIMMGTTFPSVMLPANDIDNGSNSVLQQIKVPRNDGTNFADYLLGGADINCIAVDGGNRKWFGTNGNGVYLISADNMTQLQHFLSSNSQLLSDNIEAITINDETGEVFFGTDKGLCSYMSDATATSATMNKNTVYAYPNPVKPDFTGLITVTGLTMNADVKIVTANGTLVAEGTSNGGTFTWDGCDDSGKRVASGVYMVQTATSDGKKGTVCKIAIVR